MAEQFDVKWIDLQREPRERPNPMFPEGIDVVIPTPAHLPAPAQCTTPLPYPAKRCGIYEVECRLCRYRVAITTAGRPDDPRSLTMPCQLIQGGAA